ncbi:MAG: sulfotransferase family protein, partial [Proteobacteria bacterium]|nr:sulfotransferase family protein [Pseudomonadota bacterium]
MNAFEDRAWKKIRRYLESDQQTAARIALENLVHRAPTNVEARVLLAVSILSGDKRVREPAAHLHAAAGVVPDDSDLIAMVALAMVRVGEIVGARRCLESPDVAKTTSTENLMSLAHVHQLLGEHRKALAFMDRAKALGYDNPDFRYFRALQLQFNGRLEEAEAEMEGCLTLRPTFGRASLTLARLKRQTADSNHIDYIRAQIRDVEKDTEDHASLEFAQFKELDDLGDYESAWIALERANSIMRRRLPHDAAGEESLFSALIALTAVDFMASVVQADLHGAQPIFVIGLPRSGTTLL